MVAKTNDKPVSSKTRAPRKSSSTPAAEPKVPAKVFAQIAGSKISDNGEISIVAVAQLLDNGTWARNLGLTLGRTVSIVRAVEIFTLEGEKRVVIASGVPEKDSWTFTLTPASGKAPADRSLKFDRSGARKQSKDKQGNDRNAKLPLSTVRDPGTDLEMATSKVVGELGWITRSSRSGGSARVKAEIAARESTIEQLIRELKAAGVDEKRIKELTGK